MALFDKNWDGVVCVGEELLWAYNLLPPDIPSQPHLTSPTT